MERTHAIPSPKTAVLLEENAFLDNGRGTGFCRRQTVKALVEIKLKWMVPECSSASEVSWLMS